MGVLWSAQSSRFSLLQLSQRSGHLFLGRIESRRASHPAGDETRRSRSKSPRGHQASDSAYFFRRVEAHSLYCGSSALILQSESPGERNVKVAEYSMTVMIKGFPPYTMKRYREKKRDQMGFWTWGFQAWNNNNSPFEHLENAALKEHSLDGWILKINVVMA